MFNTKISLYGIMIILSLVSNVIVVLKIYNKKKFTKEEIQGALIYETIGIITGAKLLSYLENYNKISEFNFLSLGFSSYGGVIGALIMLFIFAFMFKKKTKDMLFTFMPPLPLMYGVSKLGCFFAGCCHGIKYDKIGSIVYNYSGAAPKGVRLFPIQLLESIVFILIFIYIIKKIKKFNTNMLGTLFIVCGVSKFSLEFLRESHTNIIISSTQIISIFFILVGLIIVCRKKKVK